MSDSLLANATPNTPIVTTTSVPHPLHPLTRGEIEKGLAILHESGQLTGRIAFSSVNLIEPSKDIIKTFAAGDPITRILRFLGVDEHRDSSFDARINVSTGAI